jgi:hypothetical protein
MIDHGPLLELADLVIERQTEEAAAEVFGHG